MPKPSHLLATPDEVENAFYEGLQHADVEQVMACWADDEDVVCIAPGGEPVHGLQAIRQLFADLLGNGPITVRAMHSVTEHVRVMTDDGEAIAQLYALNVFHKTPQGWRLVAHHTSPGHLTATDDGHHAGTPSGVLH
jgi:ketosteroid isomerase-like protein